PERFERVAIRQTVRLAVAATKGDAAVLPGKHHQRICAEERVARPDLTALDRFQEERVGPGPEPQIGGERRVQVRRKLGEDGDKVPLAGEGAKLLPGRGKWRDA